VLLTCCACRPLQRALAIAEAEKQRKKELAKRANWLAMSPKKRERFREIRMWKKTEVANFIQRWWRYLQGQKAYYEAVKKAQVCVYMYVWRVGVDVARGLCVCVCVWHDPLRRRHWHTRRVLLRAGCRWSGGITRRLASSLRGAATPFVATCRGDTTTAR
jgi:hypothetical protein